MGTFATILVVGAAIYGLNTWEHIESQRQEAVCRAAREHLNGLETQARALASGLTCLLYTSPSPRDGLLSRMPSSA